MHNKLQVMVDIETLGTASDAVILSIGAVKFIGGEIVNRFHVGVDAESAMKFGLKPSAGTIMWWMHPDREAARKHLFELETFDIGTALDAFAQWYGPESLQTWGNGAAFDNVILRTAYEKVGLECPFKFWDDRCYRTLKNLFPEVMHERAGTHHDALDDATHQAEHLLKIFDALKGRSV